MQLQNESSSFILNVSSKEVLCLLFHVHLELHKHSSFPYSASCKAVVGSETHIVVGRLIFSRGGSKQEVGTCSNFLTHVEIGKCYQHHPIHIPQDSNASFHTTCTQL